MIDFDKMVNNHIAREHKPKQIGRYYPSEIGNCLRKLWYSYKYPIKVEPDLLKIFEVGNIVHGFVVGVLKSERNKEVELLKSEFSFKLNIDDFVVSGRVDDLILIKESGKNVLVEVKSTKNVKIIEEPQFNHVIQLQFYMYALGVHDGIILYIDKNNLQSKIFEIPFSKDNKSILDRFRILHRNLVDGELPSSEAKLVKSIGWMCKYCEYKNKCDKNEK